MIRVVFMISISPSLLKRESKCCRGFLEPPTVKRPRSYPADRGEEEVNHLYADEWRNQTAKAVNQQVSP